MGEGDYIDGWMDGWGAKLRDDERAYIYIYTLSPIWGKRKKNQISIGKQGGGSCRGRLLTLPHGSLEKYASGKHWFWFWFWFCLFSEGRDDELVRPDFFF